MTVKILVTGAAGFIGSHLVDAYLAEGHSVVGLDDLSSGRLENLQHIRSDRFRFEQMSILDDEAIDFVIGQNPDVINHHAAQKSVRESMLNPERDAQLNVLGTIRMLEAARRSSCRKFIFASSGGVLFDETLSSPPFREDSPIRPSSPYGLSKLSGEQYLEFYSREFGISAVAFRYANVYGPRQDPQGEAGVIAIFCERLLDAKTPIVFGDGDQTRDFVFVADVVRANVLALSKLSGFKVFNVGTSKETSVNQLLQKLQSLAQTKLEVRHEAARGGEARRSAVDSTALKTLLAFSPSETMDSGLAKTLDWFRSRRV